MAERIRRVLICNLNFGLQNNPFAIIVASLAFCEIPQLPAVRGVHNESRDVNRGARTVVLAPAVVKHALFYETRVLLSDDDRLRAHCLHVPGFLLKGTVSVSHKHKALPIEVVAKTSLLVFWLHVTTRVLHLWREE